MVPRTAVELLLGRLDRAAGESEEGKFGLISGHQIRRLIQDSVRY